MENEKRLSADLLKACGTADREKAEKDYREALKRFRPRIVVLDDDPTGVQTVHDVSVYTDWSGETFAEGFSEKNRMFFILTNSRSMSAETTEAVHREIAGHIADRILRTGEDVQLISRSDSTLRGHYPLETETLRKTIEAASSVRFDGEILYPFFPEGGRFTLDNIHYVREGSELVPAGQTEFARDKTFGYRSSDLRSWVEEKSGGKTPARDCICIPLEDLRSLNYGRITETLMKASGFAKIIVNSVSYDDVKAFAVAYIEAVCRGKRFMFRSAAAVPKILGGVEDIPLLTRDRLVSGENRNGGIIVVGSHVRKTTGQLEALKQSRLPVSFLEFNVDCVSAPGGAEKEKERVSALAEPLLRSGKTVAVYTSRGLLQVPDPEKQLALSVGISDALTGIIRDLQVRPSFIVAKGGITSSDIGTKGLKVHRATVMGQIRPGIPVWMTDEGSRFPGLPYIIFPGNVGDESTLKEIAEELIGQEPERG